MPAFNAAYYLATALNNVPNINLRNMNGQIDRRLDDYLFLSPFEPVPDSDHMLCLWMTYALLYLQDNPTQEMTEFLVSFHNRLMEKMKKASNEMWNDCAFIAGFPKTIKECKDRFWVDLYPSAKKVCNFESHDWIFLMNNFSQEDFEHFLSFYRTKEEQHELLNAARQVLKLVPTSDSVNDLPF